MCASLTKIRSLRILHTLNTKEISIEKLPSSYRVFANIILRYLKKKKKILRTLRDIGSPRDIHHNPENIQPNKSKKN